MHVVVIQRCPGHPQIKYLASADTNISPGIAYPYNVTNGARLESAISRTAALSSIQLCPGQSFFKLFFVVV